MEFQNNNLKIISLGGFGNVTQNMFVYETDRDILIVDCGMGFPSAEMFGVDFLIPDVAYLQPKKNKIRGLVLTHGHDDHVGALPYILPKLPNIPIYGSRWALALVKEKLKEFSLNARFEEIKQGSKIVLGEFGVEFIEVTHSIPETMHLVITTPVGIFYHAADFKLDLSPVMGKPTDQALVTNVGRRGILCLLSDSLRAEREGFTPPEKKLEDVFEREISSCPGKFFVTTMSSNVSRLKQAIEVSLRHNRKIVPVGRSVEKNVELALKLGYLKFPKDIFLTLKAVEKLPPQILTLLVAGSQAQPGSAMERIVNGEHDVKIRSGDKVVFSSDFIPGNETAIYTMIDSIYKLGGGVSYVDIHNDIHVSGHGSASDLKKLIELVRPKYLIPIGGNYRHMVAYRRLGMQAGYKKEDILLPDDGQIVEFNSSGGVNLSQKIEVKSIMVDALGVGDVGNIVLRDRQVLSEEGIVVAIIPLDVAKLEPVGEPEIVTRGFVYVKSSEKLISQAREETKRVIIEHGRKRVSLHYLRKELQERLEKFFFQETGRRPMVLIQIVEV